MSNDEFSNAPAPQDRREAVREKAQLVRAKQSRVRTIRRISLITAVAAVVVVAAVAVTWVFASAASKPQMQPANVQNDGFAISTVAGVAAYGPTETTPAPTPEPSATPDSTPATPSATEPDDVAIRVYVDYLSPGAKDFQLANVQQLSKWVTEDAASLTYYPVAMLTAKSNGTKYSLRAAGAAACVATHAPDSFFAFNNALLDQQPEPDTDGMTDPELADLAVASGADDPKTVRGCIEEEDFSAWAKAATDRALQGLPDTKGVALTSAPMILVNGTPYQGALDDPTEFAQFVLTIASDTYYRTASPTPTASSTPSATPPATP